MAKKKPQPKPRKKPTGPSPFKLTLSAIGRTIKKIPLRVAIAGALCVLVVALAAGGLLLVEQYVRELPEFRVAHIDIELPEWCPPQLEAHLKGLPRGFADVSIYNEEIGLELAASFHGDPWVRKVEHVRKQFPDRLVVKLDVRRPAYLVERRNREAVLVDAYAHVLPLEPWIQEVGPLQVVSGVRTNSPPAGRFWSDRALLGGIETIDYILRNSNLPELLHILGADVSNFDGVIDRTKSDIDIIAGGGNRINWGRPPSTNHFGEVPARRKLEWLEAELAKYPNPIGMEFRARFADTTGAQSFVHNRR